MEEIAKDQAVVMVSTSVRHTLYIKFFWRWMLRYRADYIGLLIFLLSLFVLVPILAFWHELRFGSRLFNGYPFFTILPMMTLIYLVPRFGRQRDMYQAETLYAFYEDHVKSRCTVLGTAHYKATPYANFTIAVESKSAFILMLPARKAFQGYTGDYYDPDPYGASVILDKQCLSEEQVLALRELFGRAFGEKFRARN